MPGPGMPGIYEDDNIDQLKRTIEDLDDERSYASTADGRQRVNDNELQSFENPPRSGTNTLPEESYLTGRNDVPMEDGENEFLKLKSRLEELELENRQLRNAAAQTDHKKDDLERKLTISNQEKEDLSRKLSASLVKIKKLNDLIVKNSQQLDEPPDNEILEDTFRIRSLITNIVRTNYAGDTKFYPNKAEQFDGFYQHFYLQRLRDQSAEGRKRLLISAIFAELQLNFFEATVKRFGLDRETEGYMQAFERQIESSNKVQLEEVIEWRMRTVLYASRLNVDYHDSVKAISDRLSQILSPVVLSGPHGDTEKGKMELKNSLYSLCHASLNLSLKFRASKTKYDFKNYKDNTRLSSCDNNLIDPQDAQGQVSSPLDPNKTFIFCTLFGALVKTRSVAAGGNGDSVVLDKAHVIVYESQERKQRHDQTVA